VRVRLKGVDASELLTERGEEANQLMMGIRHRRRDLPPDRRKDLEARDGGITRSTT
jgi:hypothetical protein